jgi:hypothetical protein
MLASVAYLSGVRIADAGESTLLDWPPGQPDPNWHSQKISYGYPLPWLAFAHAENQAFQVDEVVCRGINPAVPVAGIFVALTAPVLAVDLLRRRPGTTWACFLFAMGLGGLLTTTLVTMQVDSIGGPGTQGLGQLAKVEYWEDGHGAVLRMEGSTWWRNVRLKQEVPSDWWGAYNGVSVAGMLLGGISAGAILILGKIRSPRRLGANGASPQSCALLNPAALRPTDFAIQDKGPRSPVSSPENHP